jgi:hypothetical protein
MEKNLTNKEIIEKLLKIRNKEGEVVPFKFNIPQLFYWARKTARNLILKPRQKGLSKIIDADQLIDCIRKPTNAVVVSHEREATKRLFSAVKFYIDNLDVKPVVSIDSQSEITFPKRGSSYYIGTAGQKAFGRGDTVHRAHLSEAAFYDSLKRILGGIEEAVGMKGQIDIETTANGSGDFKDMWQNAKEGKSAYTPIFIPWFIDDEYSVDHLTEDDRKNMSESVQELLRIPDDQFMANLDEETKRLVETAKREWGITLTAGQLKWRTYKIWDKGELFFQEYPEDDVSCFLQSGRGVFNKITTDAGKRIALDNPDKISEEDRIRVGRGHLYAAVDGAEGTLTGDRHVLAIIYAPPKGRARVAFEYASNEPIDIFWHKIKKIFFRYEITLAIEKNGVGKAHCIKADELGIQYEEWTTDGSNRSVMITDLEEAYRKGYLIETYKEAEEEARSMEYDERNRPVHKKGRHDDRVFARAIAWQMVEAPTPRISFI